MKKYVVRILQEAEQDLLDIYFYVAHSDSPTKAENLLTKIEELYYSLESFPERGHIVPELQNIAIYTYRELHFKSYRIIYQIIEQQIAVHSILDGRRNLEYLLMQRLCSHTLINKTIYNN